MKSMKTTRWKNPTETTVSFRLLLADGTLEPFTIPPGESVDIYSEYDPGIRKIVKGIIVGGLAPQLHPENSPQMTMHDALARAAAAGEMERRVLAQTGVSPGSAALDPIAALEARFVDMQARFEMAEDKRRAELAAKDAEIARMKADLDALTAPSPAAPGQATDAAATLGPAPKGGKPRSAADLPP